MSFGCTNDKSLGLFIQRNNYLYARMKDLRFELGMQLFESEIVIEAIEAFLLHQYKKFDAVVGDCKCQVRVSMFLDILQSGSLDVSKLKKIELDMEDLQDTLQDLIDKTEKHQMAEMNKIKKIIEGKTFYQFFEQNKLHYVLPYDLFLIVILFFTYLNIEKIIQISHQFINKSKADSLLKDLKKKISLLTIEYEKKLNKEYGSNDIQKILEVIQGKGFCFMTAFYPSFIPIWNKLKDKRQLVGIKILQFCDCGGLKNIENKFFRSNKDNILEEISVQDAKEAAFLIEGYQFNGTLVELKEKLGIEKNLGPIQELFLKLCNCSKNIQFLSIDNPEEAILANFAQHRQFTNDVIIDWQGLGLADSELKKEFDYLNTLSGYGVDDMSRYCITHIYVSTVEQELEDQKQLLEKLGKK